MTMTALIDVAAIIAAGVGAILSFFLKKHGV